MRKEESSRKERGNGRKESKMRLDRKEVEGKEERREGIKGAEEVV